MIILNNKLCIGLFVFVAITFLSSATVNYEKVLLSKEYLKIEGPKIPSVPTMTTISERMHLYWIASRLYNGEGAVVEVGPWLGGSTGYIAAGLRDANRRETLYVFDKFDWNIRDTRRFSNYAPVENLRNGDDFSYLVKDYLQNIYKNVALVKAEISRMTWEKNNLIELLHVDAPKNQYNLLKLLQIFGPSLIEEKSLIIMQDFLFPPAYALPIILGSLVDNFEYINNLDTTSDTVVFKYKKKINLQCIKNIDIYKFSENKILNIWEKISSKISDFAQRSYFNMGLAMYFFDINEKEKSLKIANENIPNLTINQLRKLKIATNYSPSLNFFLKNILVEE